MVEAMSIPAEVLKLRLHSLRLPEQVDHARSIPRCPKKQNRRFQRELDGMSDGTGHPKTFHSWNKAHYNDGPVPFHYVEILAVQAQQQNPSVENAKKKQVHIYAYTS
jgi:hypothetical protein